MDYSTLGRSGLRVSRLSLGAMTFGAGSGIWGQIAGLDRAQAARLVATAVDQGVNLIDTADAYSQGKSEEIVGQVIADLGLDETRMLVATKVRLRTGPGQNEVGLGRSHIMRSVETSLKRIGRDHIDPDTGNAPRLGRPRDAREGSAHRRVQLQSRRPGARARDHGTDAQGHHYEQSGLLLAGSARY